jgi:hypothetical protein
VTKGKNHNSIIFLTTLSVYLGLVLVGATPQVLAQAALTRNFDIQIEAEVKDDLDNKPDDDVIELSGPTGGYFDDLEHFVGDLLKLHQIEKFNLDYDRFHLEQSGIVQCNLETVGYKVTTSNLEKVNNRWLVPAIAEATDSFENYAFLGDCLPSAELGKKKGASYGLDISYDKVSFKFELSVTKESPQRAKQLLDRFNRAYKLYEVNEDEPVVREIHKNTSFKSENNQVFIVTRLPRGSIDSLLATKNAQ